VKTKIYLSLLAVSAVTIALTACGGGSSSDDSSGGGDILYPKQEITAHNVSNVASVVYGSSSLIGRTVMSSAFSLDSDIDLEEEYITNLSFSSSNGAKNVVALPQSALSAAVEQVQKASDLSRFNGVAAKQASSKETQTVQCSGGGSMTVTATDNNGSGSISYNQCKRGTTTTDGQVLVSVEGSDEGSDTRVTIPNWKLTSDQVNVSLTNSEVRLGYDNEGYIVGSDFTGSVSVKNNGTTQSLEFNHYKITVSKDVGSNVTMMSQSGAIKSNCMNGWIKLSTAEKMATKDGDYCPTAGMFHYSGASNNVMSLQATSQGGMNLLLNGSIEKSYVSCKDVSSSGSTCPEL